MTPIVAALVTWIIGVAIVLVRTLHLFSTGKVNRSSAIKSICSGIFWPFILLFFLSGFIILPFIVALVRGVAILFILTTKKICGVEARTKTKISQTSR